MSNQSEDLSTIKKSYLETVNSLQNRLDLLELRLSDRIQELKDSNCLLDQLLAIEDAVKTITRGNDKYNNVLVKLIEIEKILSCPDFSADDIESKKALLLLSESQIRQESQLLQEISTYEGVLDSFPQRNFQSLLPVIEKVRRRALEQAAEVQEIRSETRKLVLVYAEMVETTRLLLEGLSNKCK